MSSSCAPGITIVAPPRHEHQVFVWAHTAWNIAKLQQDIDAGAIKPARESLGRDFIVAYAERVLALRKPLPAEPGRHVSLFVHVDLPAALRLPEQALADPVIMLQTSKGIGLLKLQGFDTPDHVLADGQHRIAKAYYGDVPELPMYLLSLQQSNRYLMT